jgi:hypothetical protein
MNIEINKILMLNKIDSFRLFCDFCFFLFNNYITKKTKKSTNFPMESLMGKKNSSMILSEKKILFH